MRYHIEFNLDFKRNPYPGTFIVIEGIDGSGKTTQIGKVIEKLRNKEIRAVATKEPTKGPIGQLIKKIINKEITVPKVSIQYLFCADRVFHLEEVVIPKLKEGVTVISDRYFWSSVAYGLFDVKDHEDKDRLLVAQSILSFYHRFFLPNLTVFLRVLPRTALARISKVRSEREFYEEEDKLRQISENYEWVVRRFPKEITVIDGEKSVEEVTKEILSKLPQGF